MSTVDYEKGQVPVQSHQVEGNVKSEAVDLYGDAALAEQMGYVKRGLKSRHIQFIALGGTIGTGLFLGIGGALATSGPLSILLGYSITGCAIWGMMQCLGEMATWLPLPGAIPQMCARYFDDALGFAVGWNQWYNCAMTLCVEISAAALLIQYWNDTINSGVWIAIIIVLVFCLNIFAVAIYGEAEFIFASIKIITIVGLLILAFILCLGGGPNHDRIGFRYWKNPGAMNEYIGKGSWGRFLGLFKTFINAAFSYGGVEMVAVAAGETENPRKNIPKAVRRVFWRILFFYVFGTLAIGVLVPSNSDKLLNAANLKGAAASPWVIAMQNAGIGGLPSVINAVVLSSATSSANAFLYTGSRYIFALAQQRQAPRIFLKCNKKGVPIVAVSVTGSISLLTFMTISAGGNNVFNWFANLVTVANLITWCCICIAFIRFKKAMDAQGIDRNTLVFKSPFQPYVAQITLGFFVVVTLLSNFSVFTKGRWDIQGFITGYIGIPLIFLFYFAWKFIKGTKIKDPSEVDLFTGKAAIDAEYWPEVVPRNIFEKIWFWIA